MLEILSKSLIVIFKQGIFYHCFRLMHFQGSSKAWYVSFCENYLFDKKMAKLEQKF